MVTSQMNSTRLISFGREYEELCQTQFSIKHFPCNSNSHIDATVNKTILSPTSAISQNELRVKINDRLLSYYQLKTTENDIQSVVEPNRPQFFMTESREEVNAQKLLESFGLDRNLSHEGEIHEHSNQFHNCLNAETASDVVDQKRFVLKVKNNSTNDNARKGESTNDQFTKLPSDKLNDERDDLTNSLNDANVVFDRQDKLMQVPISSEAQKEKQMKAALNIWIKSGECLRPQKDQPPSIISHVRKILNYCYRDNVWEGERNAEEKVIHQKKDDVVASIFTDFRSAANVDGLTLSTIETSDQDIDLNNLREINILDGNESYDERDEFIAERTTLLQRFNRDRSLELQKNIAETCFSNHRVPTDDITNDVNRTMHGAYVQDHNLVETYAGSSDFMIPSLSIATEDKKVDASNRYIMENQLAFEASSVSFSSSYDLIPLNLLSPKNNGDGTNNATDNMGLTRKIVTKVTTDDENEVVSISVNKSLDSLDSCDSRFFIVKMELGVQIIITAPDVHSHAPQVPNTNHDDIQILNFGRVSFDDFDVKNTMIDVATDVPFQINQKRRVNDYSFDEENITSTASLSLSQASHKCATEKKMFKLYSNSSDCSYSSLSLNSYLLSLDSDKSNKSSGNGTSNII